MPASTSQGTSGDPGSGAAPDVFSPARLGPLTLRNRIIKAATFEGMSRKNLATDELVEFHRRAAAGGVGMTTVSYLAVSRDGMGAPNEIHLREEAIPGLRRITEAVHAEGAAVSAQLGHAGAVGAVRGKRTIGPSGGLTPMGTRIHAATAEDIALVTEQFAAGARMLVEAGFDAIELHLGHGYLLSSWLSPRHNRRTDGWGGTLENRARFPRQVARAVRDAVGDAVAVIAKINMADGVPGGLWLDESVPVAKMLEADGALDALELTGGSSLANPMYLFRGEVPLKEFSATLPPGVRQVFQLVVGKRLFKAYPFEEAYFLPYARQFRAALDMPLILLGGINRLDTMQQALAEGFSFVAMGRALLREPDLLNRMQAGKASESLCVHCNKCMTTIYRGTHCVLLTDDAAAG